MWSKVTGKKKKQEEAKSESSSDIKAENQKDQKEELDGKVSEPETEVKIDGEAAGTSN